MIFLFNRQLEITSSRLLSKTKQIIKEPVCWGNLMQSSLNISSMVVYKTLPFLAPEAHLAHSNE